MGCDVIMKFFETTLEIDASSLSNFVTSCVNIIVVAPFRLTQEVSKKIIYLKRNELESVLFLAALIAFGVTGANAILSAMNGTLSLSAGKFPLILQLVGAILLTILFAIFSKLDSLLFNTFESTAATECEAFTEVKNSTDNVLNNLEEVNEAEVLAVKGDETVNKTSAIADVDTLLEDINLDDFMLNIQPKTTEEVQKELDFGKSQSVISQYDFYSAPPVIDRLDSSVLSYANTNQNIVNELEALGNNCVTFSNAEIEALKNTIESTQTESSYFDSNFMSKFSNAIEEDEETVLMSEIPGLDDNSALL